MARSKQIKSTSPGTLTFIEGIKTALVDDHHQAFYWWWDSKLKNATLFHVDAHDDMGEAYVTREINSADDYTSLRIANFICPAVHHDIISSIYWLNPHSEQRKLQYFGQPKTSFSEAKEGSDALRFQYQWENEDRVKIEHSLGELLAQNEVILPGNVPLIVDIDLDAFCCHRKDSIRFLGEAQNTYDATFDFEKRIDETMETLSQLQKPKLITIASSQGDGKNRCYVPPFMVDDVGRYLAISLRKLYG